MYYQQGDVLIGKISKIPTSARLKMTNVLQEGEHTGHAHRLFDGDFQVFEVPESKQLYLRVVEPVNLRHEEHKEFKIMPGDYQIGIVEEYDPFEELLRQVQD